MSDVRLDGAAVLTGTISIPAWGIWWADIETEDSELSGAATIALPGLALTGTIMRGGAWEGRARYRVAGGAGRWGTVLPPQSYSTDVGVKRSTVIGDAAAGCGERADVSTLPSTDRIGAQWARLAGPASRTLAALAPAAWYVDETGTTRIGRREASARTAGYTVIDRDRALGWIDIAADDVTGLLPGVTVEGVEAVDVVHRLATGALRTRLWASLGATSRRLGALGRIIDAMGAVHRYAGVWSYRVVAQHGERLDLQAERAASGMPDLQRVRTRYSPGVRADHALGSMVLVAFVDRDPSRPVVVAGDDPESPGHVPAELLADGDAIELGAAYGTVVREGDTITLADGSMGLITITTPLPLLRSRVRA